MGHTRVVCRLNLDKILPLLLRETKICSSHPIPPILFDTTTEQKFLVSKISLRCIILLIQNCCSISRQLHFRKVMHLSQSVLRLLNEQKSICGGFCKLQPGQCECSAAWEVWHIPCITCQAPQWYLQTKKINFVFNHKSGSHELFSFVVHFVIVFFLFLSWKVKCFTEINIILILDNIPWKKKFYAKIFF